MDLLKELVYIRHNARSKKYEDEITITVSRRDLNSLILGLKVVSAFDDALDEELFLGKYCKDEEYIKEKENKECTN